MASSSNPFASLDKPCSGADDSTGIVGSRSCRASSLKFRPFSLQLRTSSAEGPCRLRRSDKVVVIMPKVALADCDVTSGSTAFSIACRTRERQDVVGFIFMLLSLRKTIHVLNTTVLLVHKINCDP